MLEESKASHQPTTYASVQRRQHDACTMDRLELPQPLTGSRPDVELDARPQIHELRRREPKHLPESRTEMGRRCKPGIMSDFGKRTLPRQAMHD